MNSLIQLNIRGGVWGGGGGDLLTNPIRVGGGGGGGDLLTKPIFGILCAMCIIFPKGDF